MPSSTSTNEDKYAPKSWGQRDFDFEVPSGGTVLLRKMGPMDLIKNNLQDKLDFVTSLVMSKHVPNGSRSKVEQIKADRARREAKAQGKDPDEVSDDEALQALMDNPERFTNLESVIDAMMLVAVMKPKLVAPPEDDDDRVDGVIYTDTVPFEDKMAIFNKLMGGINKLEQFRKGSEEAVADVAPVASVRSPRKRSPRTTK